MTTVPAHDFDPYDPFLDPGSGFEPRSVLDHDGWRDLADYVPDWHPEAVAPVRRRTTPEDRRMVFGLVGLADDVRNWLYSLPTGDILYAAQALCDELTDICAEEAAFLDCFADEPF